MVRLNVAFRLSHQASHFIELRLIRRFVNKGTELSSFDIKQ